MISSWLWVVLLVYWIVSALKTKGTAEREPSWARAAHLAVVLGAFYLLLGGDSVQNVAARRVVPDGLPWQIVGSVLTAAGVGFAIWARATLGANWSGAVTIKRQHEIVRDGPYRWVRHPIYTGVLLGAFGTAVELGLLRGFIALAVLIGAFLVKLSREEKLLSEHFPDQYPDYRLATKRIVPYVW